MPGFRISNVNLKSDLKNYDDTRCLKKSLQHDVWLIQWNTLNKFMNDKLFEETDSYIIVLEGVVYNLKELQQREKSSSWLECIVSLIDSLGELFVTELKGSFSGAIYFKSQKLWFVFTGPLGEKAIFYYADSNYFIIGSQLNYITDAMNELKLKKTPDIESLKQFFAYNCYFDNSTCINEVKRLYPGDYCVYSNGSLSVHNYYVVSNPVNENISNEEAIEKLDTSFRSGVQEILNKNKEYGYTNLVNISGGYDSRMIAYTVKSLGEANVLLTCYSQTNTNEQRIAEEVASKLGFDYVFRSLDSASCMMHIDDFVLMNNGATYYCGITGGKDILEMMAPDKFGLELTGLLGDIKDGAMPIKYGDEGFNQNWKGFKFSSTLSTPEHYSISLKELKRFSINQHERFWFYTRGMLFGMTSYFLRQNFTETGTPYGSKEFIENYLSIPWSKRVKDKLLTRWMIKKYPQAGKIPYATTGLSANSSLRFYGKVYLFFQYYIRGILNRSRKYLKIKQNKPRGMNDFSFWYDNNDSFRTYLNTYYNENFHFCTQWPEIQRLVQLYWNGSIREKLLSVTVLSIIKNYIC